MPAVPLSCLQHLFQPFASLPRALDLQFQLLLQILPKTALLSLNTVCAGCLHGELPVEALLLHGVLVASSIPQDEVLLAQSEASACCHTLLAALYQRTGHTQASA